MRGFLFLPQNQATEEQQNQGFSLFYLPFPTDKMQNEDPMSQMKEPPGTAENKECDTVVSRLSRGTKLILSVGCQHDYWFTKTCQGPDPQTSKKVLHLDA